MPDVATHASNNRPVQVATMDLPAGEALWAFFRTKSRGDAPSRASVPRNGAPMHTSTT
jgi:hypothetical protein